MAQPLTMAVIGSSFKENEMRAPIHPDHFQQVPESCRSRMVFERGYGERFGISDGAIAAQFGGLASREQLFAEHDIILLPKPTERDFPFFRDGQILWGWPHCVQGEGITQLAIDRRLTLIGWEAMHHWVGDNWDLHIFHLNNELAGYCSVLQALQLAGCTGVYGPYKRTAVIGFGSTGRGAVHALRGMNYQDVTLFTHRPGWLVKAPVPGLRHWHYSHQDDGSCVVHLDDQRTMPMAEAFGHFDVIVNCIMQDTDHPQMFVRNADLGALKPHTIIVDVSCDAEMGFEFARPTSFDDPAFMVGEHVLYYGVDHSPSYLWNSATNAISEAALPYLADLMAGPVGWERNITLKRAIEIRDGVILNRKILTFQRREEAHPHPRAG